MFTDTHAHIFREFYDDIETVLSESLENNVNRIINSGYDQVCNEEVIALANKYSNMYATIGIHPQECLKDNKKSIEYIKENIQNPKVIGIGEIGLDYYHDKENKEKQMKLFESQLQLAQSNNISVVIHTREATEDTLNILKKYKLKGVIHSFTGSYETALEYIKLGYKLGINGVLTFKNCNLKEVIEKLDLKYIILETDAPYLTPVPFRGKQNSSKNILIIAKFICDIKGISLEQLAKITNQNIAEIFDI